MIADAIAVLLAAVSQARAVPPTVEATCSGSECECIVGQIEGQSVELTRVDVDGFPPGCVNLLPLHSITMRFQVEFVDGTEPILRVRSYAEPDCQGARSDPSHNACVVLPTPLKSPVFIQKEAQQ